MKVDWEMKVDYADLCIIRVTWWRAAYLEDEGRLHDVGKLQ